jgi:Protein of unknown function (DUF1194)
MAIHSAWGFATRLGLASPALTGNCRLALVLALDVSSSVERNEDRLQREGLARAGAALDERLVYGWASGVMSSSGASQNRALRRLRASVERSFAASAPLSRLVSPVLAQTCRLTSYSRQNGSRAGDRTAFCYDTDWRHSRLPERLSR